MSDANANEDQPPAGWSWAYFKAVALETGQWIWGTAQGGFNEKLSTSQIIVDAIIGCIPLLGDATAVRDLIAISIGLSEDPKKRNDTWQWVLLFVLLAALIPVFGGAVKGVGRLLVKMAGDLSKLKGAARAAEIAETAKTIVAVLNHFKFVGNAEKWLLQLRFADYQARMVNALDEYTTRVSGVLGSIKNKLGSMLPQSMLDRIESLKNTMAWLKTEGHKRVPDAVLALDQQLREVQAYIRSGGETTSRTVAHEAITGERAATYTDETRLHENGPLPRRSARGGWEQNPSKSGEIAPYYTYEEGYPDLTAWPDGDGHFKDIAAFSGRIVNRPLQENEKMFRLFGPSGETLGITVDETYAGGNWWGLGEPPTTAEKWRDPCAVLDEFNRDGYMVTTTAPGGAQLKAATGTVSEQVSDKIPGQALEGGAQQAVINLDATTKAELTQLGKQVIADGKPRTWTDPKTGMVFEVRKTSWSEEEVNGVIGYADAPGPGQISTQPLGERERGDKKYKENAP